MYNRVGRLRLAVVGAGAGAQGYGYTSGSNRLASMTDAAGTRTIAYDARGNTASETRPGSVTVTTAYDGYGRLVEYDRSGAGTQVFTYNGLDDRVTMLRTTGTRHLVYDADGRVMGEYGASAADVKAEFIWALPQLTVGAFGGDDGVSGYAPLAVATPDDWGAIQLNWVHGNHLGVPLVTTDAVGNLATTPNDYFAPGFPGQSRVFADLYYNRYRDYDPVTGRYIQADPIGLGGGSNPYLYALANPINLTDPTGEIVPMLIGIGIGVGLEYLTNPCATWSDLVLAGALGGIGGGLGGYLLSPLRRIGGRFLGRVGGSTPGRRGGVTGGAGGPRYGPGDPPVRIPGKWSPDDIRDGLRGKPPEGLGRADLHHGGQMPGGAKHEIIPTHHRNNPALHGNPNQGVTDAMRRSDRQLHWWH